MVLKEFLVRLVTDARMQDRDHISGKTSSTKGSFDSVLTGLVYASTRKITCHNIDIKGVFRNAILDELVYTVVD